MERMKIYMNEKKVSVEKVRKPLAVGILLTVLLTACGAPEEKSGSSPVTFEKISPETEETGDHADAEAADAGDSSEETQPGKRVVHSVAEYAALEDNACLDDEKRAVLEKSSAIEIYDAYLRREWSSIGVISSDVRMGLGWVDEDDLPELFLCAGDFTASGVMIFTIDADTKEVISLGEFSQFGNCIFTERKNRIWSQYGNQGYFQECISMIENGKAKLIGGIISDGSGVRADGTLYYAGFPISEDASGSRGDMDFGLSVFDISDEDNYLVDEGVYVDTYHELMCDKDGAVKIQMDYDAMITMEPDL